MWFRRLRTRLVSMRMCVQSLALISGLGYGVAVSRGVGHRPSLDLALLWLGCSQAATALIRPLIWELPYALGVALKRQKKKKKNGQKT